MRTRRGNEWTNFWRSRPGRARDKDFEDLTRPHVGALWRTALRMTGDREAADELTQETCLKAFRAFGDFKIGTNYKAWIFRILTNLCLDFLRRRARSPIAPTTDADIDMIETRIGSSEPTPDVQLIRKEFRNAVLHAMQRLTPEVRLVVSLALLEERSYQEIADVVNCPIGTVRSRLSRGRRQLQQDLQHYMTDPVVPLIAVTRIKAGKPVKGGEEQ